MSLSRLAKLCCILLVCFDQTAHGIPVQLTAYLHDLEYTLTNEVSDDDDLYLNLASARKRAASITSSSEDIKKYIEAFASQELLRARPSCDQQDNVLITHLKIMAQELTKKDYQAERVAMIIDETLGMHKTECFEILTNNLKLLDRMFDESDWKAYEHLDEKLAATTKSRNGPVPSFGSTAEGAYNMIKLHADNDNKVKLILPGIFKLLQPIHPIKQILKIESTVVDELYEKYAVQPCATFFVKTEQYSTAIKLEQEVNAIEFRPFLKRYNSCMKILTKEEDFNKSILDRLYELVAEMTGGVVKLP